MDLKKICPIDNLLFKNYTFLRKLIQIVLKSHHFFSWFYDDDLKKFHPYFAQVFHFLAIP